MTGLIKPMRLLSHFTAGVMLRLFRPFKVGDLIEVAGIFGTVEEIELFYTIIITPDNRSITVSNTLLTSDKMTNYSAKGILRLELRFGVGDDDDLFKIKPLLKEILKSDARVLNNPAPTVAIVEAADSRVNFAVRPYVKVEDYWDVHVDLMEQIKLLFLEEAISTPYSPQTEKACPSSFLPQGMPQSAMKARLTSDARQNDKGRQHTGLNPLRYAEWAPKFPVSKGI